MLWSNAYTKALSVVGEDHKTVRRSGEPPQDSDYRAHAAGTTVLSVVPGSVEGTTQWCVFDYDGEDPSVQANIEKLFSCISEYKGILIEPGSTRGFHLTLLFSEAKKEHLDYLRKWVKHHINGELEFFPSGSKTISLPMFGDSEFWTTFETDVEPELVSLEELYAYLRMLPRDLSLLSSPLPLTSQTDTYCMQMVAGSAIDDEELRYEVFKTFNAVGMGTPHKDGDFLRLLRKYNFEWEAEKEGYEAPSVYNTLTFTKKLVDESGARFFVEYVNGDRKLTLQLPPAATLNEKALHMAVLNMTGDRLEITRSKAKQDVLVARLNALEAEELDFHLTNAGKVFAGFMEWVRQNPCFPKDIAISDKKTTQFVEEGSVYVKASVLRDLTDVRSGRYVPLKKREFNDALLTLERSKKLSVAEIGRVKWYVFSLDVLGLVLVYDENIERSYLEALNNASDR